MMAHPARCVAPKKCGATKTMNVIDFPGAHVRASAASRAARLVSLSEVRPADRATSVERIADHLSAGMLSRCHHLETAGLRTPMSDAIASLEGHKAITSRKERKSVMPAVLGQIVLKRKDILALDAGKSLGHTVPMGETDEKHLYDQGFVARVASARIATGKKQWQLAEALGVKQDQYKHWESKKNPRLMPHEFLGRFCLICSVQPLWLLTGKGPKALEPLHAVETEPAPMARPKKANRSKAA